MFQGQAEACWKGVLVGVKGLVAGRGCGMGGGLRTGCLEQGVREGRGGGGWGGGEGGGGGGRGPLEWFRGKGGTSTKHCKGCHFWDVPPFPLNHSKGSRATPLKDSLTPF